MLPSTLVNSEISEKVSSSSIAHYFPWIAVGLLVVTVGIFYYQTESGALAPASNPSLARVLEAEDIEKKWAGEDGDLSLGLAKASPEDIQKYLGLLDQAVVPESPSSSALALLKRGRIEMLRGETDAALATFKRIRDLKVDATISALGVEGEIQALEAKSNWNAVVEVADFGIAIRANPLKHRSQLAKARALRELGQNDQAKSLYDQVLNEHSGAYFEHEVKVLRAMIQGSTL